MRELYILTEGTTEPIPIDQVKAYVDYLGSDSETQQTLENTNKAARLRLEQYCGRNFVEKTMILNINKLGYRFYLPFPPISAITSITPYANTGVAQTVLTADTDYYLLGGRDRKYIRFATLTADAEYYEIKFTSGYKAAGQPLPEAIIRAILAQTRYDFKHPSGGGGTGDVMLSNEAKALVAPYKEYEI